MKNQRFIFFIVIVLLISIANPIKQNSAKAYEKTRLIAQSLPNISPKIANDEYNYTFKISDKLVGTGDVKLKINDNQIKGIANGIGKTSQCNVNFNTSIDGSLNNPGDIMVSISGIGNPKGIPIIGKISFQGPMEGTINHNTLSLTGTVHIKGKLARYAGFKDEEELLIEIPNLTILKASNDI